MLDNTNIRLQRPQIYVKYPRGVNLRPCTWMRSEFEQKLCFLCARNLDQRNHCSNDILSSLNIDGDTITVTIVFAFAISYFINISKIFRAYLSRISSEGVFLLNNSCNSIVILHETFLFRVWNYTNRISSQNF